MTMFLNCGALRSLRLALRASLVINAVLQHMRVRAMLSKEDEKLILEYVAP
jgi:hypothetical protein